MESEEELIRAFIAIRFPDEVIKEVEKRLGGIKLETMKLKLGKIGAFHILGKPRIVWIKIEGKEIWELQKKVDDALEGIFKREERFMSHLTIARLKYVKDKKGFDEYIKGVGIKDISFRVEDFYLMRSELLYLGPSYNIIKEYGGKYRK